FIALLGGAAAACSPADPPPQGYQRFFIDLPGWTGFPPVGKTEEGQVDRLITASRSYSRGDAVLSVSIWSRTATMVPANTLGTTRITINGGHMRKSTIRGFEVTTTSWSVVVSIAVTLSPDATFSLLFNNISEEEAMAVAQKFDWKGIQALVK